MLAILGYLRKDQEDEVLRKSSTFAEFARRGDANPVSFKELNAGLIERMRRSGAIFGRKFSRGSCHISRWSSLVLGSSATKPSEMGQKKSADVVDLEATGEDAHEGALQTAKVPINDGRQSSSAAEAASVNVDELVDECTAPSVDEQPHKKRIKL